VLPKKVKALEPIDLSTNTTIIERVEKPQRLVLAGEHNVFNPVRWQRRPDGSIYRQHEAGVSAMEIAEIRPLRLRVEFSEIHGTPPDLRYRLLVLNEVQRAGRPTPRDAGVGDRNNMFTIEKVIGEDPANPEALQVLLAGDKEPVRISKQEPHERIIGYTADLRHTVEKREWKDVKVKDELSFGGETYNIVAITPNEVVLSAKSNKKQTILEFRAPPR
jgi:hypothetical protein